MANNVKVKMTMREHFMVDIGFGCYRHFLGGYRVFEGKDAPKQSIFGLTSSYMGIAPLTLDSSIFLVSHQFAQLKLLKNSPITVKYFIQSWEPSRYVQHIVAS